jgi:hypothetical protein
MIFAVLVVMWWSAVEVFEAGANMGLALALFPVSLVSALAIIVGGTRG